MDIAQHLTWVNAMRNSLVIPDFHMPAATTPGLFSPLMAMLAQVTRFGIDASAVYAAATLMAGILGVYSILGCLRLFSPSRCQSALVIILLLAAAPVPSSLHVWHSLRGAESSPPIFYVADALFANGPHLTDLLGAASIYASLALITHYVLLGRRKYLYLTALVAALSGLCHPFEVFTIIAAVSLTLFVIKWPNARGALADSSVVTIAGLLSVLPYVFLSLTVPWMRQVSAENVYLVPNLLRLLGILGIPSVFVLFNLVVGPRLRLRSDIVLQCWFAATLVVLHVPGLPWAIHMANGLGLVAALLAIRQISKIPHLHNCVSRHPRAVGLITAAALLPALFVHVGIRYIAIRDSLKLTDNPGLSAVSSQAEHDLIHWFGRNGLDRDLVLAPTPAMSSMLATAPIHTMASHWLFSGTYELQSALRDRFYRADWTEGEARRFLRTYGINYVVVPEVSPIHRLLNGYPKAALFPPLTVYHIPENHMRDRLPDR